MESDCECCGESANNYFFGMCIACIKKLPELTKIRDAAQGVVDWRVDNFDIDHCRAMDALAKALEDKTDG